MYLLGGDAWSGEIHTPSIMELVEAITGRENNVITPLFSDGPDLPNIRGIILGINLFPGF